jgi:hypothetical protein
MTAQDLTLRLVEIAAPAQTLFVLLYGLRAPWYRSPTGRAIFTKALSLALILDLSVLAYYVQTLPTWVGPVVMGITAAGVYMQLGALLHEWRLGRQGALGRTRHPHE